MAAVIAEGDRTEVEVEVEVVDLGVTRGGAEADMEAGGEYHNLLRLTWICIAQAFRGNIWRMARDLITSTPP